MIQKQLSGTVTPPPDMMDAARKSLSDQAFADLMEQTGGREPTPDELCKMVDSCRQAQIAQVQLNEQYVAAINATEMSSSILGTVTQ